MAAEKPAAQTPAAPAPPAAPATPMALVTAGGNVSMHFHMYGPTAGPIMTLMTGGSSTNHVVAPPHAAADGSSAPAAAAAAGAQVQAQPSPSVAVGGPAAAAGAGQGAMGAAAPVAPGSAMDGKAAGLGSTRGVAGMGQTLGPVIPVMLVPRAVPGVGQHTFGPVLVPPVVPPIRYGVPLTVHNNVARVRKGAEAASRLKGPHAPLAAVLAMADAGTLPVAHVAVCELCEDAVLAQYAPGVVWRCGEACKTGFEGVPSWKWYHDLSRYNSCNNDLKGLKDKNLTDVKDVKANPTRLAHCNTLFFARPVPTGAPTDDPVDPAVLQWIREEAMAHDWNA